MNILEAVSIELPCVVCGDRYPISLDKVLLSEHMLHEGCPVPPEYTTECPPLYYGHLIDHNLIHELQRIWLRLEENADASGGKLLLREVQGRT
jgi:hypothetical protein